jgi:hypothetical protein
MWCFCDVQDVLLAWAGARCLSVAGRLVEASNLRTLCVLRGISYLNGRANVRFGSKAAALAIAQEWVESGHTSLNWSIWH